MTARRWSLCVVALLGAGSSFAWAGSGTIDETPVASAPAVRAAAVADLVSLGELSGLSGATELAGARIAEAAGGAALPTRGASIGMVQLSRNGTVVQEPPSGYLIPMGLSVIPVDLAPITMSHRVAATINADEVVFGETSATLRGAQVGDFVHLQSADGRIVALRVGLVAPDAEVGSTELVVSASVGDLLGVVTKTRMIMWGFDSRERFETVLAAAGLDPAKVRVIRSWDPPSPDSTIGMARTKKLLGEFAYRPTADGVALIPGWSAANIVPRTTLDSIPLRVACHRVAQPAVQGAINEIASRGLAGEIDVANSNAVGGCFVPRFNRVTGNLGLLSRHTWGQALDINISQNPLGSIPRLNCDVVRIFRKWGFAWGGNFQSLDGMHFEYVGERRDLMVYPSRFCPNHSTAQVAAPTDGGVDSRATMFADDGLISGG